jgi:hypothetical protein
MVTIERNANATYGNPKRRSFTVSFNGEFIGIISTSGGWGGWNALPAGQDDFALDNRATGVKTKQAAVDHLVAINARNASN